MNSRRCVFGIVACVLSGIPVFATTSSAAQVDAVWNVGSGNWNGAGNWLPAVVPNNGAGGNTYHVRIDDSTGTDAVVAVNLSPTIDLLTISAGDTLFINAGQTLSIAVGPIVNDGLIAWNATFGSTNNGILLTSSMSLEGSGAIEIGNRGNNRLLGITGGTPPHLTHGELHTIRGGGTFSGDTLTLTNNGVIEASDGFAMNLDLAVGANVNAGTLQAVGVGALNINGSVIDNSDGVIAALDTATVNINSSTIVGGLLETDAGAAISGTASTLQDVTLNGLLRHDNAEDFIYQGTIVNNGTIQLNGTGSGADKTNFIVSPTGVTLTGPGAIEANNHPNFANYFIADVLPTPPMLVNSATHTIRGSMSLGTNLINLTNQGLIDANNAVPINLDCAAGTNVNTGVIQASGAGVLNINGTDLDNTGGVIKALDTATVNINSSTINGGPLEADPTAAFSGNGSTLKGVHLTGLLRHDNAESITYEGAITNDGLIQLNGVGSGAIKTNFIASPSGVTVTGTGAIELNNNANFANYVTAVVAPTLPILVNDTGHTIRGSGILGANVLHITNDGAVLANQSLPMVIDPPDSGQGFLNNGTIEVETSLNIVNGNFTNAGTVNVALGAGLTRTGAYVQTAGTTTLTGDLAASLVELHGGEMLGHGAVVSGLVQNFGAVISPGDAIDATGFFRTQGGLQCGPDSVIQIDIGGYDAGDDHDLIWVYDFTPAGTLRIRFVEGFDPQIGDQFSVLLRNLVPNELIGAFDHLDVPCNLSGRSVHVSLSNSEAVVSIVAGADIADVNCDCASSEQDVLAFVDALLDPAAFDAQYPDCEILNADFNDDGLLDGRDVQPFMEALVN
ncbi:MAG: hypothetical protein H6818_17465 [Phycisphaerales bacterium]|nr:hypothetical protein [Phycisphaerales bacterium]MCB9864582.1 hypothetical protein [Phycisphaerales bacterium]